MSAYPIPPEALKQSIAFVGRTGSGKSFAAKGGVEQLLRAGARVCIIDPTSVWHGLRSSADGKSPGFPIAVFGGDHADAEIGEASGAPLATLLAGKNLPAIIDVSEFTIGARTRFMTAFLEELYRAKSADRSPLTLVIDEADMFAPQRAMPDQTVMLSRMEQICRRGRVRGFRPWLITQRPATLHKDVLSQANTLVALQLTAPQDRDAIGAWIEGQADREQGKRVLADLPKLKKGEAWVWSPTHDVLDRVRFPVITTFDSGRSPEEGETAEPTTLADVDLGAIGDSLREAEAEHAENDPKALRVRIKELEREAGKPRELAVDVEALAREYQRGRREALQFAVDAANELNRIAREADAACTRLSIAINAPAPSTVPPAENPKAAGPASPNRQSATPVATHQPRHSEPGRQRQIDAGGTTLPKAERSILTAIAQRDPKPTSRAQASILSGYSIKSSSFANALGALRSQGLIDGRGDDMRITPSGKALVGKVRPLPSGAELVAYWCDQLPKAESIILQTIVERYPRPVTKDDIATRSGYSSTSSSFANAIGKLRSLALVHGRGELTASRDLFE